MINDKKLEGTPYSFHPSAFRYAQANAIRQANQKIADGVECQAELQGP
jgi:hypothetical protein